MAHHHSHQDSHQVSCRSLRWVETASEARHRQKELSSGRQPACRSRRDHCPKQQKKHSKLSTK